VTNTNDPIAKQAAIVAALTNNQVQWTVAHRNVLLALKDEGAVPADAPPEIVKDVLAMLTAWQKSYPNLIKQ
jgi:hypothetical protein